MIFGAVLLVVVEVIVWYMLRIKNPPNIGGFFMSG